MAGSASSICCRLASYPGGSIRRPPSAVAGSSTVNPGASVATSNSTTGLPEVDRSEILPVDHRGDVDPFCLDLCSLLQLYLLAGGPERDMVYRSDSVGPAPEATGLPQVNHAPEPRAGNLKADQTALFACGLESKSVDQEIRRSSVAVFPESSAMQAADAMLRRQLSVLPGWNSRCPRTGDQLEQQPVRIGEGKHLLVEASGGALVLNSMAQEALDPEPQ